MRLSWCLFVQAVHAAGRESLLKEMSETDRDLSERLPQFLLSLSGDQGQDLARIRAFYADKTGLHPALAGKIRLRDDI